MAPKKGKTAVGGGGAAAAAPTRAKQRRMGDYAPKLLDKPRDDVDHKIAVP